MMVIDFGPSIGNINRLVSTGPQRSQQRPLECLGPEGVNDGVGAAVEDGDGVGEHAEERVVGVRVDHLGLPPDDVGHVAHRQDEGHDGHGRPPPLVQFALKSTVMMIEEKIANSTDVQRDQAGLGPWLG